MRHSVYPSMPVHMMWGAGPRLLGGRCQAYSWPVPECLNAFPGKPGVGLSLEFNAAGEDSRWCCREDTPDALCVLEQLSRNSQAELLTVSCQKSIDSLALLYEMAGNDLCV